MADQPVINLDAEPDNANWIRILAAKRPAVEGRRKFGKVVSDNDNDVPAA